MKDKKKWQLKLGIILMIACIPFFLAIPLIPFLNLSSTQIATLITISLVIGEILFWGGGLLVGKELFIKYKSKTKPEELVW